MTARTMMRKIWDRHVVADLGDDYALLYLDRRMMHDLGGGPTLAKIRESGRTVHTPGSVIATVDHAISSAPGHPVDAHPVGARLLRQLRDEAPGTGIRFFDLGEIGNGIVHVIGPELGLSLPGLTIGCSDSHTATHGGVGAFAFGIGASELEHALVTHCLVQRRPRTMRIRYDGSPPASVAPKDIILHTIGRIGAAAGNGYAVEYAGEAIRAMPLEGRLTVCNLSIEFGAKVGMCAPDDTTYEYLAGRRFAPTGGMWDRALDDWRALPSDEDAVFDCEHVIDVSGLAPQITWGTSPQDVLGVDGIVPDPAREKDAARRAAMAAALDYMGLTPGAPIEGTKVDRVFIGSCTNSRLSDLREAARLAKGRKVAEGVVAWVVPGSETVKRDAEAEGLDRIFRDAGFDWREASCSMCAGCNGEIVAPRQRCVSTSNRNFVGRQGPQARTHLASPAMAVAAAVTGAISDVRRLGSG